MTSESHAPPRTGRVLAIGEMLIDLIVDDGAPDLQTTDRLAVRPGGALANGAVALARLGVASGFCGVVGADPFGDRLRRVLRDNGVDDTTLRATPDAGTTLAFAWKDARGDGNFTFLRLADGLLSVDDIEAARIPECAAILIGSVVLPSEPSRDPRADHSSARPPPIESGGRAPGVGKHQQSTMRSEVAVHGEQQPPPEHWPGRSGCRAAGCRAAWCRRAGSVAAVAGRPVIGAQSAPSPETPSAAGCWERSPRPIPRGPLRR